MNDQTNTNTGIPGTVTDTPAFLGKANTNSVETDKVTELILAELVENPKGEILLDGVWYSWKLGCDGMDWLRDNFRFLLSQARAKAYKKGQIDKKNEIKSKVKIEKLMVNLKTKDPNNQKEADTISNFIHVHYIPEIITPFLKNIFKDQQKGTQTQ